MDNKLSELKAAAMAATPGPWILDDDSWSEGDNANVSTEERYDGRIVSIAQIEGGGSESGFDEPFSAEQQANARYITAANPAVVLALLAELEAKDEQNKLLMREIEHGKKLRVNMQNNADSLSERIAELESANKSQDDHINQQQDRIESLEKTNAGLGRRLGDAEKRLATPVRLPRPACTYADHSYQAYSRKQVEEIITSAGMCFTIEGDE